jgi:adenylate cyclase
VAEQRVQRRLAAILAADVVGYSRMMEADETGTLAALKTLLQDFFAPKTKQYGGRIFKTTGDGALVEFTSAVDAVNGAIDIQQALSVRNSETPESRKIELRIGISLGDVIVEGSDLYGNGVNVAARLEAMAAPGGICISGNVYEHVRGAAELQFEDLGEQQVKNIERPVRTYRVWLSDEARIEDPDFVATESPPASLGKSAVAVLPFKNMSGDPTQEYFADGLTEDLITALSQWRTFPVIARNSTFTYKDTAVDVRRASEELGARYIIEGSVRKSGNRIRVSTQLIEGSTGHHLWAENLDRDVEDLFELQDDLTRNIAATVMPELEQKDIAARASVAEQNLDAWGLLHQALPLIYEHHPEGYGEARAILQKAIDIDPHFARAYSWIAYSYNRDVLAGAAKPSEELWGTAIAAAQKSIELDEFDSYAHFVLGLLMLRMGQHDQALWEQQRATELNPSLAVAYGVLGQVLAQSGRTEEGIMLLEKCLQLNPRDPRLWNMIDVTAYAYITAGNYEKAEQLARDSIRRQPTSAMSHLYLAVALGQLERIEDAKSELATACDIDPDIVLRHESIRPQKFQKDRESVLVGLHKAGWEG